MTATLTPHVTGELRKPAPPVVGIPFSRLVRVELRKQVDTRAGRWLLILIAAVTALVMVVYVLNASPGDITFEALALAAAIPQMLLLPVVGIMATTSEWSQRTGLVTFALEPRRGRVVAAKILGALLVALAVVAAALVLAAVVNVVGALALDGDGSWAIDGGVLGGFVMLELLVVAQGVAFGLVLLNTPAAIVVYYVLPTAWTIITSFISWMEGPRQWLDMDGGSMALLSGSMTGDDWAKLGVASIVWVLLPIVAGWWRVQRAEIK